MALKKARKNYLCANCRAVIQKGMQYWSIESSLPVGPGNIKYFVSSRICVDCLSFLQGK